MEPHIQEYISSFGDPYSDLGKYQKDSRLAKAYEVALDIRKFEIELYWKRSACYWLLVGGIAAALGLLLSGKADAGIGEALLSQRSKEVACFVLSLSGATIGYAWGKVNEGSKFWQRNWEFQVGILEQEVVGPLYKTVLATTKTKSMYSVSQINGYISSYFTCIFTVAAIALLSGQDGRLLLINMVGDAASPTALTFLTKLVIACAHIWFILKLKNSSQARTTESSFDSKVEASVRKVTIVCPVYGTDEAKRIWKGNEPKQDGNFRSFIGKLHDVLHVLDPTTKNKN